MFATICLFVRHPKYAKLSAFIFYDCRLHVGIVDLLAICIKGRQYSLHVVSAEPSQQIRPTYSGQSDNRLPQAVSERAPFQSTCWVDHGQT